MAQVSNQRVVLSTEEQDTLRGFRESNQWGQAYQFVGGLLRQMDHLPAEYEPVMLWFEGASLVNFAEQAGESAFADLIRFYTSRQTALHFNSEAPAYGADMQRASDEVAEAAVNDILGNAGAIPNMAAIAEHDATAVGRELFDEDLNDTASTNNAAWSGTTLFSLLGNDQTGLLLRDRSDTNVENLNNLEDLRNIIFAVDAFNYGLQKAVEGFDVFSGDWGDLFPTGVDTFWNANNSVDLALSFASGYFNHRYDDFLLDVVSGGQAEAAFTYVVQQDRFQLINDLSELFGLDTVEVTANNMVSRAHALFSHIETQQQLSLALTRLDELSVSELLVQAQHAIAYRYAIVNAHAFVLEGADAVYEAHNTGGEYDLSNFSDSYLQDRAEYLGLLLQRNASDASLGALPSPGSALFHGYQENIVVDVSNPCLAFSQTRYQYIPIRSIPSSLTPTVCDSAQPGLLAA